MKTPIIASKKQNGFKAAILHFTFYILHCVEKARPRRAFSTLELLFVVTLITLLIALLTPGVRVLHRDALKRHAKTELESIAQALLNYQLAYGVFPPPNDAPPGGEDKTFTWTDETRTPQSISGEAYELDLIPLLPGSEENPRDILFITVSPARMGKTDESPRLHFDPWGVPYRIIFLYGEKNEDDESPATGFILISCGPDKNPGGNDDIILQSN